MSSLTSLSLSIYIYRYLCIYLYSCSLLSTDLCRILLYLFLVNVRLQMSNFSSISFCFSSLTCLFLSHIVPLLLPRSFLCVSVFTSLSSIFLFLSFPHYVYSLFPQSKCLSFSVILFFCLCFPHNHINFPLHISLSLPQSFYVSPLYHPGISLYPSLSLSFNSPQCKLVLCFILISSPHLSYS